MTARTNTKANTKANTRANTKANTKATAGPSTAFGQKTAKLRSG
jgi:hypothetical protein